MFRLSRKSQSPSRHDIMSVIRCCSIKSQRLVYCYIKAWFHFSPTNDEHIKINNNGSSIQAVSKINSISFLQLYYTILFPLQSSIMFSKKSLVALAVCTTLLSGTIAVEPPTPEPMEGEEPMNKSPMSFCIEAPCDQEDREKCPAAITTSGNGHPACKVFETATVLGVGDFEASDGG